MKIVLTGAGGGLASAFLARAAEGHEVTAFTHAELPIDDDGAVRDRITAASPDLVINCAAMTSVDACELEPAAAFRANAAGAGNVATAATAAGATLLHLSTDYVFDGEKGEPYDENDEPAPVSVYGRSKLAGEQEVQERAPDHLIVRTSWVFGSGRDFLTGALRRLAAGETVPAITDLASTPTFVGHLAERLVPVIEAGLRGILHLGGPRPGSWHEILAGAVTRFALPGRVVEQKADELARPAPRPRDSALTSIRLRESAVPAMPPLDEALDELMEAIRGGD